MSSPSPALRRLLQYDLDSFEKLELALQLRTAGRAMPVEELAFALQVGSDVLRRVAAEVAATRLIELDPAQDLVTLRGSEEDHRCLDEAAALYESDRPGIMRLMSRIAMDRLRSLGARTFADAFRIRRRRRSRDGR